jgi:hypothetical protein
MIQRSRIIHRVREPGGRNKGAAIVENSGRLASELRIDPAAIGIVSRYRSISNLGFLGSDILR